MSTGVVCSGVCIGETKYAVFKVITKQKIERLVSDLMTVFDVNV